jgi:SAM-dependent methyltransferase
MSTVVDYWQNRYIEGKRGSGPGSRGEEAKRKATFINGLIEKYRVRRIIDWGCGDGTVAGMLRSRRYVGLDVSEAALALCRGGINLPRRSWIHFDGLTAPELPPGDLALSLDVIFHLTDDKLYRRHLDFVFGSAPLVCVHSSNRAEAGEWHVLHREFVRDVPDGWQTIHRPADERDIDFWVFKRADAA